MNEQEYEHMMEQNAQIGQVNQLAQAQQATSNSNYYLQEQEKNLAETQLDVNEILSEAYHLLKQDVLVEQDDGLIRWKPLPDAKQRALTDWGVDRIMQLLKAYINKNTLLSNFDDVTINRRMLKFMLALNGMMLMKYEHLFRKPTFEECKQILKNRLEEKKQVKMFSMEMAGLKPDEETIKKDILLELEDRIESELEKIRHEQRKEKLREYEVLITQLEAMVEATHNRAWKGEERGSIRRHTNISEIIGAKPSMKEKGGVFGWMKG